MNINISQENAIIKKYERSRFIVILIIAIFIITLGIILSINIRSINQEKALQEQLDLGNKYLNELDYEQAIVAYETAVEIDPMSVDAYLGLASAYEQQGNYDKALEVLELGYEKTQSEIILQEIERIKAIISQGGNGQTDSNILAADSKYPIAVQGRVVEGIYHNPYYEYPLSNEDKAYLVQIIEQAEQGNYESALNMVDNDRLITIVETFADGESYINTMVDDKKVHICASEYDGDDHFNQNVEIIILPVDIGNGYYFWNYIQNDSHIKSYGYGNCKEGVFWGDYSWKQLETTIQGERILDGNAMISNGLFDGQHTVLDWSNVDNATDTYVREYNMGLLEYWNLQEDTPERCRYIEGYCNGNEFWVSQWGTIESNKEWLDTWRYSMVSYPSTYIYSYKGYSEIDGGYRYYYW